MCESHKHIAGVAVQERTPVHTKGIEVSPEDKVRAVGDKIAELVDMFGHEAVAEALKRQNPPSKK